MLAALQQSPLLFAVTATLVGLCVGSFLNVVIYRLPIMMRNAWHEQCRELAQGAALTDTDAAEPPFSLVKPRSACPQCGTQLRAIDNIPVLSYLLLRGKCAHCGTGIAIRYPLIELLTALLSLAVALRYGFSYQAIAGILLTWVLIALSFIDIDEQLLPDDITLPGLWLGLAVNLYVVFTPIKSAVIGAIAGYLLLWSVFHLFRLITGKEGMGYGDFKLLAMLGAWLGWSMLPLIIILSAVSGAVIGIGMQLRKGISRDVPIPFGPYLAVAGWIAMMWGDLIVGTYLQFSGLR